MLIYSVPNRGNHLLLSAFNVGGAPGDGFFFKRGDIILYSGWQGDIAPRRLRNRHSADREGPGRNEHYRSGDREILQHAAGHEDAVDARDAAFGRFEYQSRDFDKTRI